MSGDQRGWVDAFDRVPVNYSPPAAPDREPSDEAWRVREMALRVVAKLGATRNAGAGPSLGSR